MKSKEGSNSAPVRLIKQRKTTKRKRKERERGEKGHV
jgi:hypothetical protein